jgi:hypothetical protein
MGRVGHWIPRNEGVSPHQILKKEINMIISDCCGWPPVFEVHEEGKRALGFCSKCSEHAVFIEEDKFEEYKLRHENDSDSEAKTIGVEDGKNEKS